MYKQVFIHPSYVLITTTDDSLASSRRQLLRFMSELLQNIQLTGSGRVCRSQLDFIRQIFLQQIQYVLRHEMSFYYDTVSIIFMYCSYKKKFL